MTAMMMMMMYAAAESVDCYPVAFDHSEIEDGLRDGMEMRRFGELLGMET
jgi:hypothetical protein